MSETSAPRLPGCAVPAAGVLALIAVCAVGPYYYFFEDYHYVQQTARRVQDAGALVAEASAWGVVGFLIFLGGLGAVGLYLTAVGGHNRWASAAARASAEAVALARAQHQELPEGLSSMTITHNYNQRLPAPVAAELPLGAQDLVAADEAPAALPAPPAAPVSVLARLRAEGQLTPSSLYIGAGEEGAARIDMTTCGFIAVGGRSRSGKSVTTALIVAQAVLQGWDVALCDPFPNKPDGLMSLCRPLSGGIFKQAGTPEEIARTIQLVDKIGRRRIDGDRWEKPLLLVIEEFSNIVIRGMLPPEVLDLLPAMAMLYAAVGVHGVIVGHDFSRSMLGDRYGALLRRACTHRIAHRLAPDAAELLVPSSYTSRVVELRPGRAIFWGEDSPQPIDVPLIADADLTLAARGRSPQPYKPWAPRAIAPTPADQVVEPATPAAPAKVAAPAASPTERLDIAAAELILDCLSGYQGELDAEAIAGRTRLAIGTVKNTLGRLVADETVSHRRQGRRYVYSVSRRPPTA